VIRLVLRQAIAAPGLGAMLELFELHLIGVSISVSQSAPAESDPRGVWFTEPDCR
jgi:hypothetical protein